MRFQPDEMYDYVIARRAHKGAAQVFSVAKFMDGDEAPCAVHTVTVTKNFVKCDCRGYTKQDPPRKPCRHCIMVALWVLNGDKDPVPSEGYRAVRRELQK